MFPSRLQHTLDIMLGKRGRPRRTTSMMAMTNVGNMAATPPPPRPQKAVIGGETADFLQSCGLCNRRLAPGRDIYMYRGDTAFCSLECREQQMKQDERKERRAASTAKHGEGHRLFELAAAATETSGRTESLAAA